MSSDHLLIRGTPHAYKPTYSLRHMTYLLCIGMSYRAALKSLLRHADLGDEFFAPSDSRPRVVCCFQLEWRGWVPLRHDELVCRKHRTAN